MYENVWPTLLKRFKSKHKNILNQSNLRYNVMLFGTHKIRPTSLQGRFGMASLSNYSTSHRRYRFNSQPTSPHLYSFSFSCNCDKSRTNSPETCVANMPSPLACRCHPFPLIHPSVSSIHCLHFTKNAQRIAFYIYMYIFMFICLVT